MLPDYERRDSLEVIQDAPHQNAVQSSVSNALREHCKDSVTPLSNGSNAKSSCSNDAVRKMCNRKLSFADQLSCDRQTDRRDAVTDVCACYIACGHCGRGRSDHYCHDRDVCHNKTGCQTLKLAKTCAARASETARPHATVINNSNNDVCLNTVYCRGIFTDDDDDGEIVFSDKI